MRTLIPRRTLLQLGIAPAFLSRPAAQADLEPTASRVHPGTDGRLIYTADDQGNTIHDASHAGYRGGGVAIPAVPVRETVWPVAGDNTAHVQAAIDRVSARARDAGGFLRRRTVMKKWMTLLLVLGAFAVVNVGCEADADVDDDGASLEVDV